MKGEGQVPQLSAGLRKLVEEASRNRAARVQEIVELCRERFPCYRRFRGAELEGLRRNVDSAVAAFYQLQLIEGREPKPHELHLQRRAARDRVAQGVPLDAMVGAYRIALPVLWDHLVACVDVESGFQGELLQRVPLTISANTLVTTAATEAYVEERERRMHSHDRAVEKLLRLLAAPDVSSATLDARARAQQLDTGDPRLGVYFRPPVDEAGSIPIVDFVRRLLSERAFAADALLGAVREGVIALVPADAKRTEIAEVAGKLRDREWRTGVGEPGAGAAGWRRTVREAVRAVELATSLGRTAIVEDYRELAIFDLVGVGTPRAFEFARMVLGELADAEAHPAAYETLRALCRHGFTRKVAAASLGIHPHTVAYRVGRMRERYGLDLEDAETRLHVQLALLILSG